MEAAESSDKKSKRLSRAFKGLKTALKRSSNRGGDGPRQDSQANREIEGPSAPPEYYSRQGDVPVHAESDLKWRDDPNTETNSITKPDVSTSLDEGPNEGKGKSNPKGSTSPNEGPGAPTHTDSQGRTSYLTPESPGYTTPGYEWASRSNSYNWDRSAHYGEDNLTMGQAYRRNVELREKQLEELPGKVRRIHEEAEKVQEDAGKIGYAYRSG